MSERIADQARASNQTAGTVAALVAIIAQLPSVTPELIEEARKLGGELTPAPAPFSPPGSAPGHYVKSTLDKIAELVRDRT